MVIPHIVNSLHGPTEREHTELRMNSGATTVMTDRVRVKPKRCSIKATETSARDMVDVNAATESNKKKSADQKRVPLICENIFGSVMNTRADPARSWSVSPNVMTAGNIISPISIATPRSRTDTVTAVRVSLVLGG